MSFESGGFIFPALPMPEIACDNEQADYLGKYVNDGQTWTEWRLAEDSRAANFTFNFDALERIDGLYIERANLKQGEIDITLHDSDMGIVAAVQGIKIIDHIHKDRFIYRVPSYWTYQNLFADSENLNPDGSAWTGSGLLPPADPSATDPDGGETAYRIIGINGNHWFYAQDIADAISDGDAKHTLKIWIKSNSGSNQTVRLGAGGTLSSDITVTPTWAEYSLQVNAVSQGDQRFGVWHSSAILGCDISVWHPMAEQNDLGGGVYGSYLPSGETSVDEHTVSAINVTFRDLLPEASIGYMSVGRYIQPKTNYIYVPGYELRYDGNIGRTAAGIPIAQDSPQYVYQGMTWDDLDAEDALLLEGYLKKFGRVNEFVFVGYPDWRGDVYRDRLRLCRMVETIGPVHTDEDRFSLTLGIEHVAPVESAPFFPPEWTGGLAGLTFFLRNQETTNLETFLKGRHAPLDEDINIIVPEGQRTGQIIVPAEISAYQKIVLINNGVIKGLDHDETEYINWDSRYSAGNRVTLKWDHYGPRTKFYWDGVTVHDVTHLVNCVVVGDYNYCKDGEEYASGSDQNGDPTYFEYAIKRRRVDNPEDGVDTLTVNGAIEVRNNGTISGGNGLFGGAMGAAVIGTAMVTWNPKGTIIGSET